MTLAQLTKRQEMLEQEVERLKLDRQSEPDPYRPWWREFAGRFADDPEFEEIVRLGREYRESLLPTNSSSRR